jgi:hypothetical protein
MESRMSDELSLQILDTSYVVRSDDPRWIDLLTAMWHPFVVEGDGVRRVPIQVSRAAPGWTLRLPKARPRPIADPWELAASIEYVLIMHSVQSATSVVGVHAAVLARDSSALLLVGKSGTGKTTLALELVGRGWDYLSDDLAAIDRTSRQVLPFPKPLKIEDAALWQTLAPSWSPPSWLPQPEREFMVPAAVVSDRLLDDVPVRTVAFLEPSATASIVELDGDSAMTAARDRIRASDPEAIEVVRSVFESAAVFRLSYRDPESATEVLEQVFAGGHLRR